MIKIDFLSLQIDEQHTKKPVKKRIRSGLHISPTDSHTKLSPAYTQYYIKKI